MFRRFENSYYVIARPTLGVGRLDLSHWTCSLLGFWQEGVVHLVGTLAGAIHYYLLANCYVESAVVLCGAHPLLCYSFHMSAPVLLLLPTRITVSSGPLATPLYGYVHSQFCSWNCYYLVRGPPSFSLRPFFTTANVVWRVVWETLVFSQRRSVELGFSVLRASSLLLWGGSCLAWGSGACECSAVLPRLARVSGIRSCSSELGCCCLFVSDCFA